MNIKKILENAYLAKFYGSGYSVKIYSYNGLCRYLKDIDHYKHMRGRQQKNDFKRANGGIPEIQEQAGKYAGQERMGKAFFTD